MERIRNEQVRGTDQDEQRPAEKVCRGQSADILDKYGASRQEEKSKITEKVHRCDEGGHAGGSGARGGPEDGVKWSTVATPKAVLFK